MKRVIILGPGGSGKSTLAKQLSTITGLRLIEIDNLFWQPGLAAMPPEQWIATQRQILTENNEWIIDGDLGPYDVIEVRLRAADAIVFLDLSLARCAWRAFRRSRCKTPSAAQSYGSRTIHYKIEGIGDDGSAEIAQLSRQIARRKPRHSSLTITGEYS